MDTNLFTNYGEDGRELIRKAYDLAEEVLKGEVRSELDRMRRHPEIRDVSEECDEDNDNQEQH